MTRPDPFVRPLLFVFAISGCAGLIYEVAWARSLGQAMGQTLQAMTAVLVVFLLGLALGAAVGGRRAGTLRSPLRAYAALEVGIGLVGLLSPMTLRVVPWVIEMVGPELADGLPMAGLRLALAIVVLAPPTIAMGATFPILVSASERSASSPERAIGRLYGSNTLGAAAGAALGSFLLLPLAGTRGTVVVAALLNLLAAWLAWRLSRVLHPAAPARVHPAAPLSRPTATGRDVDDAAGAAATPGGAGAGFIVLVAALSGALGAIFQVGWVRVIALTFGSSVYALGLTLTAYILGLGLGPMIAARRTLVRRWQPAQRAAAALWLVGVLSLLLLPAFGLLPWIAAALSTHLAARPIILLGVQFICLALLLCPATMAQGAAFPPLAILAGDRRRPAAGGAGRAFAASSCGSAAGFLLAGFVAVPSIGTRRTLAATAVAALLLATMMSLRGGRSGRAAPSGAGAPLRRPVTSALLGLTLVGGPLLLLLLPSWDRLQMSGGAFLYGPVYRAALGRHGLGEAIRRRGKLLYYREDGAGVVTVRRNRSGILSLQINGKTEASGGGDMATQLLTSHLPLLLHHAPRDFLLIGLASGVSLGAALEYPIESARVVEIMPSVPGAARLFEHDNRAALDDPRVVLTIDDARSHLMARPALYDVIASQPSNPWVSGVPNLFTVDFYRLARRRLRPGGLFMQWVQAYRLEPRDLRGVVRSFLEVFPGATLWEESAGGGDYFLVGGDAPPAVDPESWQAVPANVWTDLRRAGIDGAADLLSRFVCGPRGLRAFADGAPVHTDDNLYLEWRAPLALFRDTLATQISGLNRFREPVNSLLPEHYAERNPELMAELAARLRRRAGRLAIAASLKHADRMALVDPHLAAGIDRLRRGRYEQAVMALSAAATENPDSASAHLLLGESYRGAGLCRPAIVAYRQALRSDADMASAWNGLGSCLLREGQVDQAKQALREAVRFDPANAVTRNNLGTALLQSGDLDGAERLFRQALADDPALAAARGNVGLVLRRRGNLAGALREYRAALDLDPLNLDVRYNLAAGWKQQGEVAAAAGALRDLLALDPADRDAIAMLESLDFGASGEPAE